MKKRVGIATLHTAVNYGVYLQAYAMQKKVEDFGYIAEIIHYTKRTEKSSSLSKKAKIIKTLKHPIQTKRIISNKFLKTSDDFEKRNFDFAKFASLKFNLSRLCNNMTDAEKVAEKYDACVCGSDQIWNPVHTDLNPYYFLQFVPAEKRIAYAPSVACQEIPEKYIDGFRKYTEDFACLSVRESSGAELVEKITGKKCENTVDPTLLYDRNFWRTIAKKERQIDEPYIFCYFLGGTDLHIKVIESIQKKLNKKIIFAAFDDKINKLKTGEKLYPSIEEFLSLVDNADFVLTDSFHGVAFSVNFRKDFAVIERSDTDAGKRTRVRDFLTKIELTDRIVTSENEKGFNYSEINYESSENILQNWIKNSEKYFEDSLKKVLENKEETEVKNISALPKLSCYGCTACANICPKNAIEMKRNELGFFYPEVDENKCINCGLCTKKCEILKENVSRLGEGEMGCMIAWMKDEDEIAKSSSGGMFYALAEKAIEDNQFVAGAVYADGFKSVKTIVSNKIEDAKEMRGSKYFQSDKNTVFNDIKKLLEKGEKVLFSGAPCECAAIRAFLGKEHENLMTVSYICHGPSAPKVLEKYVEEIENENESKVTSFTTRYKNDGKLLPLYLRVDFENGNKILQEYAPCDIAKIFMSGYALRNSCLECKFKGFPFFSDIYIGDVNGKYYSVNSINPAGASSVFVTTEKGRNAVKNIADRINTIDAEFDKILQSRNNILFPSNAPTFEKALEFKNNLEESGVQKTAQNMFPRQSNKTLMIARIKSFIKKITS